MIAAREAMRAATQAGRLVALAPVSAGGEEVRALDAEGFEQKLESLAPNPYAPNQAAMLTPLGRFLSSDPKAEILWIADGVELAGAGADADAVLIAPTDVGEEAQVEALFALVLGDGDQLNGAHARTLSVRAAPRATARRERTTDPAT